MSGILRVLRAVLLVLFGSAVVIGLVVWWLLRRQPGEREPELYEIPIPPAEPAEEPAATIEAEHKPLAEPAAEVQEESSAPEPQAAPDDLRRIEGIGPKISSVLQEAGITTFAQLGAAEVSQLEDILEAKDPRLRRLADPATWPEQARLAANGDWEGLAAFQAQLKGGRRMSRG
jgi:predicted flap endonuclease-1-like 5' DNA nuclease